MNWICSLNVYCVSASRHWGANNVLKKVENYACCLTPTLLFLVVQTVYVKITNEDGSTITPPVTVQVSVMSDLGTLQLQRLKQLAQIITASPVKNLGLNNSVFGKVKSVVLSSYLKDTLHGTPPTPSPAISPSLPPAIAPFAPVNSPAPSVIPALPPQPCPQHSSATPPSNSPSGSNQTPRLHPEPPDVSPLPGVYYGSGPGKGPLLSLAPSTLAQTPSCKSSLSSYKTFPVSAYHDIVNKQVICIFLLLVMPFLYHPIFFFFDGSEIKSYQWK